jgi:phage FluMu gp28-like protein
MDTAERVQKFASLRLKTIFANSVVEDFQQEYEALYVDETTAWITWEEIKANQSESTICDITSERGKIDKALSAIEHLRGRMQRGEVEQVMAGGVDIGRTRNTSEFFLVGEATTDQLPLRLMITLDNCTFNDQYKVLQELCGLNVSKLFIDKNGIGANLAENLEKEFPARAEGAQFTMESKKMWATTLKMLFQQRRVPIPIDRDLGYQVHSIKRLVTPSKNLIFDTERNEKHHADKFWALALAVAAASTKPNSSGADYFHTW